MDPSARYVSSSTASTPSSAISTPITAAIPITNDAVPAGAGAILTIDLGAVADNWRALRDRVAPAVCAGVVKADAYGLGAARVAPALFAAGCRRFFVAHPGEGVAVRAVLPDAEIAVLNGLLPGTEEAFVAHRLVPVLNHLGEVARWREIGARLGRFLPAFIHIDTGMNRLGLEPAELDRLAAQPTLLSGISLAGWISHLACADLPDHPMTGGQLSAFRAALARLPEAPASLANSSGIFRGAGFHFDLVRPGCALYGINPIPEASNPMWQTIRLAGRILQVRTVDSPMTVGYGATHTVVRRGKVATVSVGYADGYCRSLSASGHALVAGFRAPVIGRISMDLMTIDVTDVPESAAHPGAWAELVGPHRTADAVADEAGTIGYEILTSLGARYHRVYLDPAPSAGDIWGS